MGRTGWVMCKLTKTGSPVLSWVLEVEYVNEVVTRGTALPPNLQVPVPPASRHSSRGA